MSEKLYIQVVPSLDGFFYSEKFISLVMGPVGCLRGDTLVLTEYGPTPIADIDRPMRVLSWNETTCRFQLSWCGGSFPKDKGYLYRVVTPQGEFDAAGAHLLLCSDGKYRRVETLRAGDALASYSDTPLQTTEELCQLESHEDALRSTQTDVGYLCGCAALDRLRGQRLLTEEAAARAFVPSRSGAPISGSCFFLRAASSTYRLSAGL